MGRPTKLTPETHKAIVDALKTGCLDERACEIVGVRHSDFCDWMDAGAYEGAPHPYRVFYFDVMSTATRAAGYVRSSEMIRKSARDEGVSSCVYILRDSLMGKYKIGYAASDVDRRITALRAGCPQELELIAVIKTPSATRLERTIQSRYKGKHYRGEWYSLSSDDVRLIVDKYGGYFATNDTQLT